ncbi:hypothetical protein [Cohnella pontilimi]|uniref:hypothetical protein n=1 Tax=Cohnella pontilimi TaxID=2564100 RepID=UPI00145D0D21|nr:hypothetical protein [Cohnella pontilimi]
MAKNRKVKAGTNNNNSAFQTEFASGAGTNNNQGACGTGAAQHNANRTNNR